MKLLLDCRGFPRAVLEAPILLMLSVKWRPALSSDTELGSRATQAQRAPTDNVIWCHYNALYVGHCCEALNMQNFTQCEC